MFFTSSTIFDSAKECTTCGHMHIDDSRLKQIGKNNLGIFANCLMCGTTLFRKDPNYKSSQKELASESVQMRRVDSEGVRQTV